LRNLPGADRRLAEAVAAALRLQLTPQERSTVGRRSTHSADAYEAVLRGKAHYNAAVKASDRGERDLALGFFNRAIELDPAYADAHAWLAMASLLLFISDAELHAGQANAEKALSIDPDHILARRAMVDICHMLGRGQDGLSHAKRVLTIAPHDPGALAVAGRAYFRAGMMDKATSVLEDALRADPNDEVTRYHLGFTYYFSRQYLRGLDVLAPIADVPRVRWILPFHYADLGNCGKATELARLHPKPLDFQRFFLTRIFEICGDPDSARSEVRADVAEVENLLARSDSSRIRMVLGLEYAELGRRADALEQVRRAQALSPGNSFILFYAGETHAILGNQREALSYLRQAVDRGWVALYYFDQHERPYFPLHSLIDDPEFRALRDEVARRVDELKKIY
jgi:tetratricopeptide (TPR) repeat protein